ncbi:MAG: Maf family protein [Bacteroidota bacterium]
MKVPRLILASQSPRRRLLLKQIGLRFTVRPSKVEEVFSSRESPRSNARRIALEKARDVARNVSRGIVVGADTIVVVDGGILGKPRTKKEARMMLMKLSGREHLVYTGFALVDARSGRSVAGVERTRVRFRRLDPKEVAAYVGSGAPMDKAGAYGIQDDYGAVFVEKVDGCFYNVVGFPLARFYSTLTEFIRLLEKRV